MVFNFHLSFTLSMASIELASNLMMSTPIAEPTYLMMKKGSLKKIGKHLPLDCMPTTKKIKYLVIINRFQSKVNSHLVLL